jgi:16S rRNA (uracil1498-N3)-methyltransferase
VVAAGHGARGVTRRRVHLPPERISATRAALTDEARHYLRDVLRLAPGAAVELFDGQGGAWEAEVRAAYVAAGLRSLAGGDRRDGEWSLLAMERGA